jgi:hypothetical protein
VLLWSRPMEERIVTIDAERLAQAIIDDATEAGYKFKPGHQRSIAKTVLARMLEQVGKAWIEEHMRGADWKE